MWLGEIFIEWFLQNVSLCIGWPNNSCKIIVHWIARWQLLFLNWGHRKNLSWNCWAEINQLPIQKSERIYCPRREQASQICAGFSLRLEFEIGLFNSGLFLGSSVFSGLEKIFRSQIQSTEVVSNQKRMSEWILLLM